LTSTGGFTFFSSIVSKKSSLASCCNNTGFGYTISIISYLTV
jgi:hypothetical protein